MAVSDAAAWPSVHLVRWAIWLGVSLAVSSGISAASAAEYAKAIQPLLRERCYACHGALKQKAGLRLDTVAAMRKGGRSGPAVQAGDADRSLLVQRIATRSPEDRMPPEHEGELLSEGQIRLVRAWIDAGAVGPADEQPESDPREHWAFRTPVTPLVPAVPNPAWVRSPVDAFVARAHVERGLRPQPEAPRATLVRRLYVDLIGLPPTEQERVRAEEDPASDWYERLVDQLLEDPRHGERWARHWMDIWRYSDWWGLGEQLRNSQRHLWRWRDWIVDALNADTSYDEMIRLMLAADELHPGDPDRLRATGFLARNYFLFNRNQWMDEVVEHVGKGLLGLTLNCAKCHDHKYDPIGQADYYRMRAFFEPYHVRLDVVPGEPDLTRDGLPRVFDGRKVPPTYRFVRGQENQPDTNMVLTPGVPGLLAFGELEIHPVRLPREAWEPERRPWVVEAYRTVARSKQETALRALAEAQQGLATLLERGSSALPRFEAEAARALAEQDLALARAEAQRVEACIAAMRAGWSASEAARDDAAAGAVQAVEASVLSREAVQAEREVAVARARQALARARLRFLRAKDEERQSLQAEVEKAREALEKAVTAAAAPVPEGARPTRLIGAAWTPTRFFDSTKDDPTVEWGPESTGRRRALAEWITDPRHPLTARVAVNHVWNRHFGTPLVPTVFDFGRKGTPSTHPELLDWLATDWVRHGWNLKHLHRRIVTSATYRMASSTRGADANVRADPDNRYYWRRSPIRLEAQVIRDAILAHAGELDLTRGGPPVPPSAQADSKRRSLYFFHSNNERNLFLTTFDDAAVKECYRREESIVPQQALALSNGRLVHDAAWRVAQRLRTDESGRGLSDDAFTRRAFRTLLGYEPGEAELAAARKALAAWRQLPSAGEGQEGLREDPRAGLIWALLNHDDFVTLR